MFESNSNYDITSQMVNKHIPVKQLSRKELKFQAKPWITPTIKVSIAVKNNLYKKFLKAKSIYDHCKFKLYRNKLNHLLKLVKGVPCRNRRICFVFDMYLCNICLDICCVFLCHLYSILIVFVLYLVPSICSIFERDLYKFFFVGK